MAKGGRLALHAETASRGCQPVISPTGTQVVRHEDLEAVQGKGVQSIGGPQGLKGLDAVKRGQVKAPERTIRSNPGVAPGSPGAIESTAGSPGTRASGPAPSTGLL